ncbi:MAG: AraC family transcriptional regulator [Victivallales bacterium]|nr:AraC family transcriptional regulator [Victivallales bacterium]
MRYAYEKIIPGTDCSFHTADQVGNVIPCVFHVHPEYELTYIVSSYGTRFIGDNIGTFDAGDLALIGPMVPHHYYNSQRESKSESWGHARVVQFREDFAGARLFELPEMRRISRMLQQSAFGVAFPPATARAAQPLLRQLFDSTGPYRIVRLLALLAQLSESEYYRLSTISGRDLDVRPDHRMNGILRYINEHLVAGQPLSLKKTAAKACMNPQAFSRYFRKTTGKCFIDYVNEIRIGKACHMLINTDKTIAEICYDAGFGNLSNFNRHFRRIRNMSPKEYRAGYSVMASTLKRG